MYRRSKQTFFQWLRSTGIEHQPGPTPNKERKKKLREKRNKRNYADEDGQTLTIEVGNVSHFLNQRHGFIHRNSHIFLGQEHSLEKQKRTEARQNVGKKWKLHMSDLDEEAVGLGGVFAMVQGDLKILTPKPKSARLQELNGRGRVQLYAVQVSKKATILFYNVYGYTGAAKDKKAANRTNDILEAIFEDQEQQPK